MPAADRGGWQPAAPHLNMQVFTQLTICIDNHTLTCRWSCCLGWEAAPSALDPPCRHAAPRSLTGVWAGQAAQHGRHRRAAAQSGRRSPRTYCTQGDKVNAGGRSTAQQHVQEVRHAANRHASGGAVHRHGKSDRLSASSNRHTTPSVSGSTTLPLKRHAHEFLTYSQTSPGYGCRVFINKDTDRLRAMRPRRRRHLPRNRCGDTALRLGPQNHANEVGTSLRCHGRILGIGHAAHLDHRLLGPRCCGSRGRCVGGR